MHSAPAVAVRERPILFSGPMVRAILDGTKTQTRRVILPSPLYHSDTVGWVWDRKGRGMVKPEGAHLDPPYGFTQSHWDALCPFGYPGERLWVRETFFDHGPLGDSPTAIDERIEYRATEWERKGDGDAGGWSPSIHMPRWASRITLELTGVRVERVQDISEADAAAEGVPDSRPLAIAHPLKARRNIGWGTTPCSHREAYQHLWDSLNDPRGFGWDANPWVWLLEFRTVRPAEEREAWAS